MTILTEGKFRAEFLVSEANHTRSRKTGTVTSGQNLQAGQLVQITATKLVAQSGTLTTDGDLATATVGIMLEDYNASSTGPYGAADWPGAVYIARDAEVNLSELVFPTETTAGGEQAACVASLALLGIITR